jgi:hypothetical protein
MFNLNYRYLNFYICYQKANTIQPRQITLCKLSVLWGKQQNHNPIGQVEIWETKKKLL